MIGMIISGFTYPEPADVIVNARVPPAPTIAETSAPVPPPPPAPTLNVMVLFVVAPIPVTIPAIGSELGKLVLDTALGYG